MALESYAELFRRLGSHELVKKELKKQNRQRLGNDALPPPRLRRNHSMPSSKNVDLGPSFDNNGKRRLVEETGGSDERELELAGEPVYQQRRREQLGVEIRALDEQDRQLERKRDHEKEMLGGRMERRRFATQGPFRSQNLIEKIQPEVHKRLKKKFQKRKLDLDPSTEEKLVKLQVRRSYESGVLSISWKGLTELPACMETTLSMQLDHVHTMKLMGNKLKHLQVWNRFAYSNLQHLDVSNNLLMDLPTSIGFLKALRFCYLRHNRLVALPEELFLLENLETLELTGNKLETLPGNVGDATRLKHLKLNENQLTTLPWSFQFLGNLKHLDLSHNSIFSLALLPDVEEAPKYAEEEQQESEMQKIWEEVHMPGKGLVFFNKRTGKTQRFSPFAKQDEADPWALKLPEEDNEAFQKFVESSLSNNADDLDGKLAVPKLKLASQAAEDSQNQKLHRKMIIGKRRQALARANKRVWQFHVDCKTGFLIFFNNVFRTSHTDIPSEVDKFGRLGSLEELFLEGNQLTNLPKTLGKLEKLRILRLNSNRLVEIPESLQTCTALEEFEMGGNLLTEVPAFICKWTRLQKLCLHHNSIEKVCPEIGRLKRLEKLWLMDNHIDPGALPSTLGRLAKLTDVQFGQNDVLTLKPKLRTAAIATVAQKTLPANQIHLVELEKKTLHQADQKFHHGLPPAARPEAMPALKWHFEEQRKREVNGPPPQVIPVRFGINQERLEFNGRYKKEEHDLIQKVRENNGQLLLHWRNLQRVPDSIFRLVQHQLRELRLVGNVIRELPRHMNMLAMLEVLELRSNVLELLPSSLGEVKTLRELLLDDNKLEILPEELGNLTNLELLTVSGNRLRMLPKSIGRLTKLKRLEANVNHLETLPDSMGDLKSLETIALNLNRITTFPKPLIQIETLQSLQLNQNRITELPVETAQFKQLKVLHMANNCLKEIPVPLCYGPLAETLEILWLYSNQIVELCDDFHKFSSLKDIRLDFNQMRSPPEGLAATKGVKAVLEYCLCRGYRMQVVCERLAEAGFGIDLGKIRPVVNGMFVDGTGFLTKKNLVHFDKKLDAFLNGDIMQYPETYGHEVIEEMVALRERQRQAFLQKVLKQFLVVLELMENDPSICSNYFFNPKVKRRWGLNQTLLPCFALRLDAMFKDQLEPKPQRNVIAVLEDREPSEIGHKVLFKNIEFQGDSFELKREVLEDALQHYMDPFNGNVTSLDEMVAYKKPRANKNVVKHVSVVLPKLLYSIEEAKRCEMECKLLRERETLAEGDVEKFFLSPDCPRKLKIQLKRIKAMKKRKIAQTEVRIEDARSDYHRAVYEQKQAMKRKKAFDKGGMLAEHGFQSLEEANEFVNQAKEKVEASKKAWENLKADLKNWKMSLKLKPKEVEETEKERLRKKVRRRARRYVVCLGRKYARKNQLRRPWDGENGDLFLRWNQLLDSLERERRDIEEETLHNNRRKMLDPDEAAREAEILKEALAKVEEQKSHLFRIEEKVENEPSWSSDDSEGEPSEDEFELQVFPCEKQLDQGLVNHEDGFAAKGVSRKSGFNKLLGETDGQFSESESSEEEEEESYGSLSSDDGEDDMMLPIDQLRKSKSKPKLQKQTTKTSQHQNEQEYDPGADADDESEEE